MGKMKTNRSAAKRFTKTGSGKLARFKANTSHLLNGKSPKRKMGLRQGTLVDQTNEKVMKKILPYI
ncbi:MAG: 50S ribosomal protein L35 [Clostridia bacterium]|nr:50S ribosomal protein L35 [Clostridia bacterium]